MEKYVFPRFDILQPCLLVILGLALGVTGDVTITEPSGAITVSPGDSASFQCESPDATALEWYHNGMKLQSGTSRIITELEDASTGMKTSLLTINDMQQQNGGRYSCRNTGDIFDSTEVMVTVTSALESLDIEIVDPTTDSISQEAGQTFTLKCVGGESAAIQWKHNGMPLDSSPRLIITTAKDINHHTVTSILTRTSVTSTEAGTYTCADENDFFNKDQVRVDVVASSSEREPLKIVDPAGSTVNIPFGQSFTLRCVGDANAELQWYFANTLASMYAPRFTVTTSTDVDSGSKICLLTRDEADAEDNGQFSCRNRNDPTDLDTVTVNVVMEGEEGTSHESGVLLSEEERIMDLVVGSSLILQCSLEAPGADYVPEWTKGGQVLATNNKYIISKTVLPSVLTIQNTERLDAGIYKCSFKMSQGTSVVVFNITTVPCTPLLPPVNGSFSSCPEDSVLGESCTFECDSGYRLSDDTPVTCLLDDQGATHWSASVPKCKSGSFFDSLFNGSGSTFSSSQILMTSLGLLFLGAALLP